MKTVIASLVASALVVWVAAGCVIGDGEIPETPPKSYCGAYPDQPERCGQPWAGRVVQSCGEGGVVTTSLRFDRPDVEDSSRANAIILGDESFAKLNWQGAFTDTAMVCEGGLCREYSVTFRSFGMPLGRGSGRIEFWETNAGIESGIDLADEGLILLDHALFAACP